MHIWEPFLLPFLSVHLESSKTLEKNAIRTVNEVVSSDLEITTAALVGKKGFRFVRLIGRLLCQAQN